MSFYFVFGALFRHFGLFCVVLGQFRSPLGLLWLVLGCSGSFWVVLGKFISPFWSFWFALGCFGLFWVVLARFASV